jgi:DNA-binding CsgD family transcriptional regulator
MAEQSLKHETLPDELSRRDNELEQWGSDGKKNKETALFVFHFELMTSIYLL